MSHLTHIIWQRAACILLAAGLETANEPILQWRFDGESQPGAWQGNFGAQVQRSNSLVYSL